MLRIFRCLRRRMSVSILTLTLTIRRLVNVICISFFSVETFLVCFVRDKMTFAPQLNSAAGTIYWSVLFNHTLKQLEIYWNIVEIFALAIIFYGNDNGYRFSCFNRNDLCESFALIFVSFPLLRILFLFRSFSLAFVWFVLVLSSILLHSLFCRWSLLLFLGSSSRVSLLMFSLVFFSGE